MPCPISFVQFTAHKCRSAMTDLRIRWATAGQSGLPEGQRDERLGLSARRRGRHELRGEHQRQAVLRAGRRGGHEARLQRGGGGHVLHPAAAQRRLPQQRRNQQRGALLARPRAHACVSRRVSTRSLVAIFKALARTPQAGCVWARHSFLGRAGSECSERAPASSARAESVFQERKNSAAAGTAGGGRSSSVQGSSSGRQLSCSGVVSVRGGPAHSCRRGCSDMSP